MKTFTHTVFTWTVAQICLPFAFMIYFKVINWNGITLGVLSMTAEMSFYFVLFSIPSLFMSWPFLATILKMEEGIFIKSIWWLLIVALVVFVNHTIIILIISGGELNGEGLHLMIPVIISIAIAMMIRLPAFVQLNQSQTKTA